MNKIVYQIMSAIVLIALTLGSYSNAGASAESAPIMPVTYYVSTSGNDANVGTSSAPFKTIQKCVNFVQSGETCETAAGDYRYSGAYKWTKSNVTLRCPSFDCRIGAIIFEGNNNTIQGFEISSNDFKNAIRTYGNYNLILQNECHDVMEDCIWLWGTGNIVRGNYFHDIWLLAGDNPSDEPFDNHIDGIMTDNTFSPSSIVKTAEDLVIDGNIIVMDRDHGSNAFFMLNAGGGHAVLPKNITWKNNTFICKDAGFCPIALFGDSTTTGMKIINNKFYNTTNQGESIVWMQNAAGGCEISGNISYGYSGVERPGNFCAKTNNQVLPFSGLPSIAWPPPAGQALTPTPTILAQPSITPTALSASATPINTAAVQASSTPTGSPVPVLPTLTASIPASPIPVLPTSTSVPPTPTVQQQNPPAAETKYDDKHSSFVYSSDWKDVSIAAASGGSFKKTSEDASSVTFTFTGQSFSVLYTSGPNFGKINVYIDNVLAGAFGQTGSTTVYQKRWDYSGQLTSGVHKLKFVVESPNSSIDAVIVRSTASPTIPVLPTLTASPVPVLPTSTSVPKTATSVPVLPTSTSVPKTATSVPVLPTSTSVPKTATSVPPTPTVQPQNPPASETKYDDKHGSFVYSSDWKDVSIAAASGGSFKKTLEDGSSVTFTFTGQSFSVLYTSGPNFGKINVYIDNVLAGAIGENGSTTVYQKRWDYSGQLTSGVHKLKFVVESPNGSIDAVIVR